MFWHQTGVTQYQAQLGLSDKDRTIKGLVVCYVVWLGSIIYDMGLWTSARCVGMVPCYGQDGFRAQVLQHPVDYKTDSANVTSCDYGN